MSLKRSRILVLILALLTAAGCAAAGSDTPVQSPEDMMGRWTGILWESSAAEPTRVLLFLEETNGELDGYMEIPYGSGDRSALQRVSWEKNRLQAAVQLDLGMGATYPAYLNLQYIQGTLAGSVQSDDFNGEVSLQRE